MTTTDSKGVAVVTGAAQGIGRSIALRLAADGYDIVLNDLLSNKENLEAVAELIIERGRNALTAFGDVSKEDDVQGLVKVAVEELGGLDVMVANAGIAHLSLITEMDVDKWDHNFNINVRGAMLCYKHAARQMIKQGRGGRIIGAASGASKQGLAHGSAYSATKFAVRSLTQSAAQELGRFGITVNAYAPGPIGTTLLASVIDYYATLPGGSMGSFNEKTPQLSAIKRVGTTDEVASLVSFLVSEGFSYITGQSILIEGGLVFD